MKIFSVHITKDKRCLYTERKNIWKKSIYLVDADNIFIYIQIFLFKWNK